MANALHRAAANHALLPARPSAAERTTRSRPPPNLLQPPSPGALVPARVQARARPRALRSAVGISELPSPSHRLRDLYSLRNHTTHSTIERTRTRTSHRWQLNRWTILPTWKWYFWNNRIYTAMGFPISFWNFTMDEQGTAAELGGGGGGDNWWETEYHIDLIFFALFWGTVLFLFPSRSLNTRCYTVISMKCQFCLYNHGCCSVAWSFASKLRSLAIPFFISTSAKQKTRDYLV